MRVDKIPPLARTSSRVLLTGQKYLLRNTQTGRPRQRRRYKLLTDDC